MQTYIDDIVRINNYISLSNKTHKSFASCNIEEAKFICIIYMSKELVHINNHTVSLVLIFSLFW